jgi:lauroyl/myristoyl acyltransferase
MLSSNGPDPHQHAPALGLTHRVLGRFHVTGFFWYRFAYWGFTRLPSWTEWLSVPFSATFFFFALGRIRGALASNLEPMLGRASHWERWRRAYRTIWAFAWCFAERYRRLADPERFRSVLEGAEHWRHMMESPGGAIVVTAHIGPWKPQPSLGPHQLSGVSTSCARKRSIHELGTSSGSFLPVGWKLRHTLQRRRPHAFGRLADALRQGELWRSGRSAAGRRPYVIASLFGRPMPLRLDPPLSLARLVPVFLSSIFGEGRFLMRAVVRPPFQVASTADRPADIAGAVHHLAAEIEWAIRQRPYQWFCFRKLWD